jgi:hypothetical protein
MSALCVRLGAIEADWLLDMQVSRAERQSRLVSVHCLMFDNTRLRIALRITSKEGVEKYKVGHIWLSLVYTS